MWKLVRRMFAGLLFVAAPFLGINWLVGLVRFVVGHLDSCWVLYRASLSALVSAHSSLSIFVDRSADVLRAGYHFLTQWFADLWYPLVQAVLQRGSYQLPERVIDLILLALFTVGSFYSAPARTLAFQGMITDRLGFIPFKQRIRQAWNSDDRLRSLWIELREEGVFWALVPSQKAVNFLSRPLDRYVMSIAERACSRLFEQTLQQAGYTDITQPPLRTLIQNRRRRPTPPLSLLVRTEMMTPDQITNYTLRSIQRPILAAAIYLFLGISTGALIALVLVGSKVCTSTAKYLGAIQAPL